MAKQEVVYKDPRGYTLLWVVVVVLLIVIMIPAIVYKVGHGRWKCSEENTMEYCQIECYERDDGRQSCSIPVCYTETTCIEEV